MEMGMMDPITEMRQMMRGFGGFNDDFMRGMQPFGMGGDPFEDMFKFSDSILFLIQSTRICTAMAEKALLLARPL